MIQTEVWVLLEIALVGFVIIKIVVLFWRRDKVGGKLVKEENLVLYVGYIIMTACTACLYTAFFKAYMSPQKCVVVTINSFGEANIELIVLSLGLPCVSYFFYHIRKFRKNLSNIQLEDVGGDSPD